MASKFDDGDAIKKAREKFLADTAVKDPFPSDRPAKFFIDTLFTAINTGAAKDIQRCKCWILDSILPSPERTRIFNTMLISLSRSFDFGDLPTSANRAERIREGQRAQEGKPSNAQSSALAPQRKRIDILNMINDVLATIRPLKLEILKKKLPDFDIEATVGEIKTHVIILAQLAACTDSQSRRSESTVTSRLIPNWVNRSIFTVDEGSDLRTKVDLSTEKDVATVAEGLQLELGAFSHEHGLAEEVVVSRILPGYHGVESDPGASWDTLPTMNGMFLKHTRGFPLRAGALQNGLPLRNAGHESSASTKANIINAQKVGAQVTSRFTPSEGIVDIDEMGNVVKEEPDEKTLNYYQIPIDDIPKIKALKDRFYSREIGYDGIAKIQRRPKHSNSIVFDVERAKALARSDGNGFENGRGGRGGFGANRGHSHNSYRGGRGGNNYGRGNYDGGADFRGGGRY